MNSKFTPHTDADANVFNNCIDDISSKENRYIMDLKLSKQQRCKCCSAWTDISHTNCLVNSAKVILRLSDVCH